VTSRQEGSGSSSALAWSESLRRRVDSLGRYTKGRFIIGPSPDVECIPAERFLDIEYFKKLIAHAAGVESPISVFEAGRHSADDAMRIHAHMSRFVRHYAGALSVPALIGLADGIGLDVSAAQCRLIMLNGVPYRLTLDLPETVVLVCEERHASTLVEGRTLDSLAELRLRVWQSLYADHIYPLIALIVENVKISPALLWTNVAEWIGVIPAAAEEYLGERESTPFLADRDALLSSDHLPGIPDVPNLLRDREYWTPVSTNSYPREVPTRRMCCLTYLLDDRFGRLCGNCPNLPLDEKIELARERDHQPAGAPGGTAERRAIARGLQRPAIRRLLRAKERAVLQPRTESDESPEGSSM
jgi:ferric iron reductase protein FhuF